MRIDLDNNRLQGMKCYARLAKKLAEFRNVCKNDPHSVDIESVKELYDDIERDLWLGELDENDQIVEGGGEWVPHTILADDHRFQSILNDAVDVPEQIPIIRNIYARLDEALRKGVLWNNNRLVAHDTVHRQRILSAATRMTINGTLPKDKQVFDYPIVGGGMVDIPKDQVVSVSLLIQDYTEDCQDNFMRLIQDETLDQFSGWPE